MKRMNVRTRRDDGFTLIELVVSIAMIGIIVPVLAAAFSRQQKFPPINLSLFFPLFAPAKINLLRLI